MTHLSKARDHLDVAAAHLRIAVDDEHVSSVDAIRCESLLIGWKNDRVILTDIAAKEIAP